jgi:hypothetical protein
VARRIEIRVDARIDEEQQLLIRMNDDRDVTAAMKLSLAEAAAYKAVPGYEAAGAIAVSCFLVADDLEAQIVVRGTRWSMYGLASVGALRSQGCEVIPTAVYDGTELLPFLIVMPT